MWSANPKGTWLYDKKNKFRLLIHGFCDYQCMRPPPMRCVQKDLQSWALYLTNCLQQSEHGQLLFSILSSVEGQYNSGILTNGDNPILSKPWDTQTLQLYECRMLRKEHGCTRLKPITVGKKQKNNGAILENIFFRTVMWIFTWLAGQQHNRLYNPRMLVS